MNGQSFFLGLIQGICEFFPISSSGHLAVIQTVLKFNDAFLFTIVVHFGTLCSLLLFYQKILRDIFKQTFTHPKNNLLLKLFVASLPLLPAGFFLYVTIKDMFHQLLAAGWGFIFTGCLILGTYLKKSPPAPPAPLKVKIFEGISYFQAFGIGVSQILALIPGISRSGVSISTGIYLGLSPSLSLHFSFLLGVLALFMACVLELFQTSWNEVNLLPLGIGFFSSFLFGYLALFLMRSWIDSLWRFGFYLIPLGILVLIFM